MINTKHTNAKDCLQKNTKDFKLRKYQQKKESFVKSFTKEGRDLKFN